MDFMVEMVFCLFYFDKLYLGDYFLLDYFRCENVIVYMVVCYEFNILFLVYV